MHGSMARAAISAFLLVLVSTQVSALFEDEAGRLDWHKSLVGQTQHVLFNPSFSNHIVVGTSADVIAAVSIRSGSLVWRQVLPEKDNLKALIQSVAQKTLLSVSGRQCDRLRLWSARDGTLFWESRAHHKEEDVASSDVCEAAFLPGARHDVLVTSDFMVAVYNGTNGQRIAQVTAEEAGVSRFQTSTVLQSASASEERVMSVGLTNSGLLQMQIVFNPHSGAIKLGKKAPLSGDADAPSSDSVALVVKVVEDEETRACSIQATDGRDGAALNAACVGAEGFKSSLADLLQLPDGLKAADVRLSLAAASPLKGDEDNEATQAIVVSTPTLTALLRLSIRNGKVSLAVTNSVPHGDTTNPSVSYAHCHDDVWMRAHTHNDVLQVDVATAQGWNPVVTTAEQHDFKDRGQISLLVCNHFSKGSKSTYRAVVGASDHSLSITERNKQRWIRHEALASVISSVYLDIPSANNDAFGFQKPIVCLSTVGKLIALDSLNGEILWQTRVLSPEVGGSAKLDLFAVQPIKGHVVMLARGDKSTTVVSVDGQTGAVDNSITIQRAVIGIGSSSLHTKQRERILLLTDENENVLLYPSTTETRQVLHENAAKIFFHRIYAEESRMQGMVVRCDEKAATSAPLSSGCKLLPTWVHVFPPGVERIIASAGSSDQIVQSSLRKMDTEVVRKYLNPSMFTVVTERGPQRQDHRVVPSVRGTTDPSVSVYVVDGVTGAILQKAVHKQCGGPANVLQQENYIYYNYFNIAENRYEVSVMELAEGLDVAPGVEEDTEFSSFSALMPTKKQQSYVIGAQLQAMTLTHTRHGISSRMLIGATSGSQILSVMGRLLDPQRPILFGASAEEQKKAQAQKLVPYRTDLPTEPENIISYHQPVNRVRQVVSYHTNLESTALVFAAGLDFFHTRVTPSQAFDVLSVEFNKPFLVGTVVILFLALSVMSQLAQKKLLHEDWA